MSYNSTMKPRKTTSYKTFSTRRNERKSRNNFILTGFLIIFLLYAFLTWILPNLIGGLTLINRLHSQPKPSPLINEEATLAPPVLNIPFEATNTATIKVKGYASAHTKVDVYVDDQKKSTAEVQDDGSFIANDVDLTLGLNTISGKTVNGKGESLSSKPIRITYSNQKPKLQVTSPSNGQLVKGGDKKVTVSGSTDAGDEITVNGQKFIVNSDGNFSQFVSLNDGDNTLTVVARDSVGNTNETSLKVTYEPS